MYFLAVLILAALACNLPDSENPAPGEPAPTGFPMSTQIPATSPPGAIEPLPETISPDPTPEIELVCNWYLNSVTPALGTGGGAPGMSADFEGAWVGTRFTHNGNFGCEEQTYVTAHEWNGLFEFLRPGLDQTFSVSLTWRLEGTSECTSLSTGAVTAITIASQTVEIRQSQIILSSEPDGDLTNSGKIKIPSGSQEGEILTASVHASSGSLGGTIAYEYVYGCETP